MFPSFLVQEQQEINQIFSENVPKNEQLLQHIAELKKSLGVNSFKGRHIDSKETEVYERDGKGKMRYAGKVTKTVPMVRIPVSTKFIGKGDSALPSQMVDLEFEKRYKKNNLGVSNIAPTDYEEFE